MDGVQGYDKDQTALMIPDMSNFAARVSVILGTPMISCRRKRQMPWKCLGGLSSSSLMGYGYKEDGNIVVGESDPSEYDEIVTT